MDGTTESASGQLGFVTPGEQAALPGLAADPPQHPDPLPRVSDVDDRPTYRERRERKAERLRGWAKSRREKSETALDGARTLAGMIPFGQPVLVGHHSEGRHRRDLQRIERGMRAGFEHAGKARDFERRAAGIEAQAEHAIYGDDPDAIGRLRERIAELEAERDRIKAYNTSCRKGKRDVSLLDEKQRARLESVAQHTPYQLGKKGEMPGYALTNLSGNINRNRKRLAALERTGP